jgi:hypothetical protein
MRGLSSTASIFAFAAPLLGKADNSQPFFDRQVYAYAERDSGRIVASGGA